LNLPQTTQEVNSKMQPTHSGPDNEPRPVVAIEHDGFRALLTRDSPSENHWVLSGYEIDENARGYRQKAKSQG